MKSLRQFRRHIALLCFQAVDFIVGDIRPHQIAAGLVFGLALGFFPSFTLHWVLLLLATLLVRLNTATAIFGAMLGYFLSPYADPFFHRIGYFALTLPGTPALYGSLTNAPVLAFARISNTVVMGSLLLMLAAGPPLYFAVRFALAKNAWRVRRHIDDSPVWSRILRTRFIQSYVRYRHET